MAAPTPPNPVRPFDLDFTPLRKIRREVDLSQAQLARAAGINAITLWRIERGRSPNPQVKILVALARALGVPMHHLFTVSEPE
jgi:transcriptional regulator with XRE-family HTH domain